MQRNSWQILVQIAAKENNEVLVKSLVIKKSKMENKQSVLSFIFSKLCNIFNGLLSKKSIKFGKEKSYYFHRNSYTYAYFRAVFYELANT